MTPAAEFPTSLITATLCCLAGIVGFVLTVIFLPDTTGLDLSEIDRMNRYYVAGQVGGHKLNTMQIPPAFTLPSLQG